MNYIRKKLSKTFKMPKMSSRKTLRKTSRSTSRALTNPAYQEHDPVYSQWSKNMNDIGAFRLFSRKRKTHKKKKCNKRNRSRS